MQQWSHRKIIWGGMVALGLVASLTCAYAGTTSPASPSSASVKLERLRIAIAPLGWDTNYTWLQSRSGQLDKRPALEYLVGIDRHTGAYIPELAEKWEMSPDGKRWTLTLRKGVKFHNKGVYRQRRASLDFPDQPAGISADRCRPLALDDGDRQGRHDRGRGQKGGEKRRDHR